jgi:putative phosphonate metabolism protein
VAATHAERQLTGSERYAIYYAPATRSAWWQFGSEWLGRDAAADVAMAPPRLPEFESGQISRITTAPRQYGFHATLKAPFRLGPGCTPYDLYRQAAVLATSQEPFRLPALELTVLDGFVALRPVGHVPGLSGLAAQCVLAFDNLRAAVSRAERERRRAQGLTGRQEELLAEWGYPYVFDEFRFHLTLTGRLAREEQSRVIKALAPRVAELNAEPPMVDALSIFVQPGAPAPFHVARRYHFSGGVEIYRGG